MMICIRILWRAACLALFAILLCPPQATAQSAAQSAPMEITADGSLEWDRDRKQMTAQKNALARQGATSVAADTLTADYREGRADGGDRNGEIWRLGASGNVRIQTENSQAFGDKAIYDIDRGVATLTGKDLKLVSRDQTVTARDSFEYWVTQGRVKAIGSAKVLYGEDVLESDTLTAFLVRTETGQQSLDRVEADGRVIITTPTERAEGDRGVYIASTQIATLTGNVRLTRGQNILEGERAEVNLATNVSRLFGTNNSSGRVRGTFYPKESQTDRSGP